MTGWREKLRQVVADLERERDELKLKLHLAKADGRDEWARLDGKLAELRLRADAAGTEAREAMDDVGDAARKLADEIREGFKRVRKTL
ncbi:MAG: hypothetical protein JNM53_17085 [Gemmatimonadetes bacterium]|nr:hypothetical protein [Gemmatimonadota bacterium]